MDWSLARSLGAAQALADMIKCDCKLTALNPPYRLLKHFGKTGRMEFPETLAGKPRPTFPPACMNWVAWLMTSPANWNLASAHFGFPSYLALHRWDFGGCGHWSGSVSCRVTWDTEGPAFLLRNYPNYNGYAKAVLGFVFSEGLKWSGAARPHFLDDLQAFCEAMAQAHHALAMAKHAAGHTSISGTLVLSVNPLDLAMCSMCTDGWTTCFGPGGAYRWAPYMLMGRDDLVVAYFYERTDNFSQPGEGNVMLPVKAWRALIWLDAANRQIAVADQYPRRDDDLATRAVLLLDERLNILEPSYEKNWYDTAKDTDDKKFTKSFLPRIEHVHPDPISLHFGGDLVAFSGQGVPQ